MACPKDGYWALLVAQWYRTSLQCKRHGFDPWVGKILWRKKWQPTPVFWTSLVAQTVKRLSTMRETWVQSLVRDDSLE